jgi:hypothetical protein
MFSSCDQKDSYFFGSRRKSGSSKFKGSRVQSSGFKVQGSKFKVQSSRFKVQGSKFFKLEIILNTPHAAKQRTLNFEP